MPRPVPEVLIASTRVALSALALAASAAALAGCAGDPPRAGEYVDAATSSAAARSSEDRAEDIEDEVEETTGTRPDITCGGDPDPCAGPSVAAAEVQQQVQDSLEAQVGVRPEVMCDEDLPAEVGASIVCALSVAGDPDVYDVTVTVTEVLGGQTANFDIEVAETPR